MQRCSSDCTTHGRSVVCFAFFSGIFPACSASSEKTLIMRIRRFSNADLSVTIANPRSTATIVAGFIEAACCNQHNIKNLRQKLFFSRLKNAFHVFTFP